MDTLFSQVDPYLASRPDPDQTFRNYIDELLAAEKAKGFGGQFVNTPAQQQQQTPQTSITEGLFGKFLNDSGSGGDSYSPSSYSSSPSPGSPATASWGMNQYGYNVGYDPAAGLKGALSMGPLGLLGGIQVSPDPLGKFAYEALLAQEARDVAAAAAANNAYGYNPVTQPQSYVDAAMGGGYHDNSYGIDPMSDPAGYTDAAMGGMGNVGSVTDASAGWGFGGDFGGYGGDTAGSGAPGSDSDSNGGGGYGGGTGGVGD